MSKAKEIGFEADAVVVDAVDAVVVDAVVDAPAKPKLIKIAQIDKIGTTAFRFFAIGKDAQVLTCKLRLSPAGRSVGDELNIDELNSQGAIEELAPAIGAQLKRFHGNGGTGKKAAAKAGVNLTLI
jgi:hypothetical protein